MEPVEHIGIEQPHHTDAERCKMIVALAIIDATALMHGALHDGEPQLSAVEVHDVAGDDVPSAIR